jgi:hypothetical protein
VATNQLAILGEIKEEPSVVRGEDKVETGEVLVGEQEVEIQIARRWSPCLWAFLDLAFAWAVGE